MVMNLQQNCKFKKWTITTMFARLSEMQQMKAILLLLLFILDKSIYMKTYSLATASARLLNSLLTCSNSIESKCSTNSFACE